MCTHIPFGGVVGVEIEEDLFGVPVKEGTHIHLQVEGHRGMVTLHIAKVSGLPPVREEVGHHTINMQGVTCDAPQTAIQLLLPDTPLYACPQGMLSFGTVTQAWGPGCAQLSRLMAMHAHSLSIVTYTHARTQDYW